MMSNCNQIPNIKDEIPEYFNCIDAYGDTTALITDDLERISYRELLLDAEDIKRHLGERNLVFCICENNVESIAGYMGFLRGRIVPVLINVGINKRLLQNLLQTYLPQYIWLPGSMSGDFLDFEQVYHYRNYVLLKTSFPARYSLHDDLALLLTTSGSTGSPKLVRQSYKNVSSNAHSIAKYLGITASDRAITTLPMGYTYGLSIINSSLLKGASIVLTNKTLMEKKFWQLLKDCAVTSFGGVPYAYQMLRKLRFSRMELPNLSVLTQAGGELGPELSAEFAKVCDCKGIRFFVMYGQTEATARMSYLPPEYAFSKAGSIGIPIPGGEFWLEDENGNIISQNDTTGELIYKDDNVTMGYAQGYDDLCKGDENNGILKTGDLARRDHDGFYYIAGRKKRFLKLYGSRVNLDEVERLLINAGYSCACAGSDDNMIVFVTSHCEADIKHFILQNTDINQAGFRVVNIREIPRNDSGKILYSALPCSGADIV